MTTDNGLKKVTHLIVDTLDAVFEGLAQAVVLSAVNVGAEVIEVVRIETNGYPEYSDYFVFGVINGTTRQMLTGDVPFALIRRDKCGEADAARMEFFQTFYLNNFSPAGVEHKEFGSMRGVMVYLRKEASRIRGDGKWDTFYMGYRIPEFAAKYAEFVVFAAVDTKTGAPLPIPRAMVKRAKCTETELALVAVNPACESVMWDGGPLVEKTEIADEAAPKPVATEAEDAAGADDGEASAFKRGDDPEFGKLKDGRRVVVPSKNIVN